MRVALKLGFRYLGRRRGRTTLTILGIASSMLLFVCIEGLSEGLDRALSAGDAPRTLIVYRKNRWCPMTSFLPERYAQRIRGVEGVQTVLPVKVYLNNCRASLDVVAFQGTPVEELLRSRTLDVVDGDVERFKREDQSAIVGREFAARRDLAPGDSFRFGGIIVDVAGVFRSEDPVDESLILTHLEFLQRATGVDRLGTVTQFEVKVEDAREAARIAREIDDLFAADEEPTDTRARAQFLTDATRELGEILAFGRIFGLVCVAVVLVLVGNTVLMSVRERRQDFGVYLTLGYGAPHLGGIILAETLALTLAGAVLGLSGAFCLVRLSHLAIGVEGVTVNFALSPGVLAQGLGVAVTIAALASLYPAWHASRTDPQALLRSA